MVTHHVEQFRIEQPRVADSVDRANSIIGGQYLQRLSALRQSVAKGLQSRFSLQAIDRLLVDAGQTTQLPKRPVVESKLAGRSDGEAKLATIQNRGRHRLRRFPAIDGMFLQSTAVLIELVERVERLIRCSGKQFAGCPHKIGHD